MVSHESRENSRAWSLSGNILGKSNAKLAVVVPLVAERMGVPVPASKLARYAMLREFVDANGEDWRIPGDGSDREPKPVPRATVPTGCSRTEDEVATAVLIASLVRARGLVAHVGSPSGDGRANDATVTVMVHGVVVVHIQCEDRIVEHRVRPSKIDGVQVWYVGTGKKAAKRAAKGCAADFLPNGQLFG